MDGRQTSKWRRSVAVTCMRCTWAYADIGIEMSNCSQVGVHLWKSAHACASGEGMRG